MNGNSTFFNTGLDCHGLKIWTKAKELGISPEKHIENQTKIYKQFCETFNIKYDSFYRTSDKSHYEKVQKIWTNFFNRGDIYKKKYKGKYCVGCESYKPDKDLHAGKCQDHPTTEIKIIEEENYFFKLSKYKNSLLNWIENNPSFLEPQNKLDELKNQIIESGDISVSRLKENCPWGIEVPDDTSQTIYVWLDALTNYIFAAGYFTEDFNWNYVVQLCGVDNLRFQAIIFQAFLESEGIKHTDKLLVHGTILDKDGRKISKTLGNVVDPIDQVNKFGVDALRYYVLAGLNTYSNSSWNEDDLKKLYNSEVVNDWGNLVARVLHLVDIKCCGKVKNVSAVEFNETISKYSDNIKELWNNFKPKEALQKTNELVKFANKYINDVKPWTSDNYEVELSNLYNLLIAVNYLYQPVFPEKCIEVSNAIDSCKKQILFNKL